MDPIYVVPAYRAKRYDGTNGPEIAEHTGYELVEATEDNVRLRVAPDEVLGIPVGSWVLSTVTDPSVFVTTVSPWDLPGRYVEHPGPPNTFPPVAAP
ncbi:hypothetical protein [Micromonospora carbonacea]|uniref:hypothetical protein n=1 Tax=Micromonospora carbonacea TaxID=47853 RepID=UPI0037170F05